MASSAIKSEEDKKEYFDSPQKLERKVSLLAGWIKASNHSIAFTGAGISTSAGIPDYRSGYDTVLPTGPGEWEKEAQKRPTGRKLKISSIEEALPTSTHMSFVKLISEKYLKCVVSQNVDGLHRKSGVPPRKLAELHGNNNLEICKKCGKEYMRDFGVRNNPDVYSHETGRYCDDLSCKGELIDTIINFGENLNGRILNRAFRHARKADLCLVMGTSLRVTPAALVAAETAESGKLVIVNLQKTPYHDSAALVIHGFCDTVMNMLMEKLKLPIPAFKLTRRLKITKSIEVPAKRRSFKECLTFSGVDLNGDPFTLFPKIKILLNDQKTKSLKSEPMKLYSSKFEDPFYMTIHFQGHYSEPALIFPFDPSSVEVNHSVIYEMIFDPISKEWEEISLVE